ncbi:MAG: nitrate/nitrite transporter NrtS [Candidatus Binatia bacterium]
MKTWTTYGEAAAMLLRGATLRTALPISLAVGTWLTAVNQWQELLAGRVEWVAIALNYLTPFTVASLGFLGARRAKV